ncbi:signal transduction histidine kinase [Nostoc sp. PCC 7524]|uniref:sensor histidine kinase n=1 Tax=Nostoc sp. (strain ATCC 29411 / PCC 7524) TaxID=28072 RepID=UPI00029F216E|nr:sensor histidine kinase [Nostoc sp. PCC 7524]AFY49745.1 signal transduction histidine kinase [Nostoc sp. PCC 7524]
MGRPIQINNHPFRFLLYLEWILLAISIITSVWPHSSPRFANRFPELTILNLTIFGLMGLRLPTGNQLTKIIYTACGISLIFITGLFGSRADRLFPFLYIIIVIRSCLIFQLPGRLSVTFISFTLFLLSLIYRMPRYPLPLPAQERFRFFTFNLALVFGLSLVFVLLLMNTVLSERQSREELAVANEKLRQYALRIENQATLEERNRIAREIHDSLGHSLTALNLQLETALKLYQANPDKAQSFLARAKELGSKALQDVRQSVSTMRSHPLQEQSLAQAIDNLAEDFQRSSNMILHRHINLEYPLSTEVNTALYRIIQESLTNISKHARATEVNLEISINRGSLHLIIQDNGRGFDIQQNTTGFGLQSMRDRTLALGGKFTINSAFGCGCQITVDIPLGRLIS